MGLHRALQFLLASSLSVALGNNGPADFFYHEREPLGPAVWAFGNLGVAIYSVDGSKQLKYLPNTDICQVTDRGQNCGFKNVVSDGKRYVFASNWQGNATLDVFSIHTGDFVASLDTCGNPWDVDYHPVREEVWVHCWGPEEVEGDTGHIDVFSTNALYSPMSQVPVHEDLNDHGHGSVLVDSSLGHIGYSTDLNRNFLYKIDLNLKTVIDQYPMPQTHGLYEIQYSHINQHLYLRSYVCCSCGFEDADLGVECGRSSGRFVDVISGPNPMMNVTGTCGHSCEGTPADTMGVIEFDTVTDTVVGNWHPDGSLGADPYVSPYGDAVAFFGNNGGTSVRILKPGKNGEKSTVWADIDTGFTEGGTRTKAADDAAFIQDSNHNIVVFSSGLSNSVVLVDLSNDEAVTKKLLLTDSEEINSNHGRGSRRNVVWAVGSDYVWVDAEKTEEFYVIKLSPDGDVNKAKVETVLDGIPARRMVYAQSYYTEMQSRSVQNQLEMMGSSEDETGSIGVWIIGALALALGVFNVVSQVRLQNIVKKGTNESQGETLSLPSQV